MRLTGCSASGRLCASLVALLQVACAPSMIPAGEVYQVAPIRLQVSRTFAIDNQGWPFRPLVRCAIPVAHGWPIRLQVSRAFELAIDNQGWPITPLVRRVRLIPVAHGWPVRLQVSRH